MQKPHESSDAPLEANREAVILLMWNRYKQQFMTDSDYLVELFKRANIKLPDGCFHCGNSFGVENYNQRGIRCCICRKKTWLTSGTFFERIKSAKAWLAAVWFLEQGIILTSGKLHRLVGIAQSSALNILRKLRTIMQSVMKSEVFVRSSQFDAAICKRSRETPAGQHPVDELPRDPEHFQLGAQTEQDKDIELVARQENLSCQESLIYDQLSDSPVTLESICRVVQLDVAEISASLIMLELKELVARMPGNRYCRISPKKVIVVRANHALNIHLNGYIDQCVLFIRTNFHGISRKYLQNYLAQHWFHSNKMFWQPGALLEKCAGLKPMSYWQVCSYVSPALVVLGV